MSKKILIRNADAIVTCDQEDRVLYNSDILICGGCIEAVGSKLPPITRKSLMPQASMFILAL